VDEVVGGLGEGEEPANFCEASQLHLAQAKALFDPFADTP
jgi:hypothetical protein